jgi:hypothetical protein
VTGIFPGVKGGHCVGLTILPPSCAAFLEIWDLHTPTILRASIGVDFPFNILVINLYEILINDVFYEK